MIEWVGILYMVVEEWDVEGWYYGWKVGGNDKV